VLSDRPTDRSSTPPTYRALRAAVLLALAALVTAPAHAALYKWTDANGRVVYSDQPPMGNYKAELVQGASPPSNPNAVKEMAAKEAELKKRQQDATESTKQTDAQRLEATKRAEQCIRMQNQARQLGAEQIALVRYNAKGEMIYIDDATRRKERAETEAWVKTNCPPAPPG
jgi:Skp family chaperone for outer membrane proteins